MRFKTRWMVLFAIPLAAWPLSRTSRPVVVVGNSMAPTYRSGQVLWMRPYCAETPLRAGDVVVFRHDGEVAIKRVMATPGSWIPRFRMQGGIYLFADEVSPDLMPCINRMKARGTVTRDDIRVPPDSVFAVGDNRNASLDSRDFGPVALNEVMGVIQDPRDRLRTAMVALAR